MNYRSRFRSHKDGSPVWESTCIDKETSRVDIYKVKRNKREYLSKGTVSNLMSQIDTQSLIDAWFSIKPYDEKNFIDPEQVSVLDLEYDINLCSPGIDGVRKHNFGGIIKDKDKKVFPDLKLIENAIKLCKEMKDETYKHEPNKMCQIPKPNGKVRNIGIACFKDKLIERAVCDIILNPVCEEIFLPCSYAYRNNRNCQLAIQDIKNTIERENITYIIEADIKGYFDNINHKKLIDMLKITFKDRKFIKYIRQVLKAGYMINNKYHKCMRGTPQGGIISPVLANLYLHYVLDTWIAKQNTNGVCEIVRYADDFIIMFNNFEDCKNIYSKIENRFKEYNLTLAKDKTNIIKLYTEEFYFLGVEIRKDLEGKVKIDINDKTILKKVNYIEESFLTNIVEGFNEFNPIGKELLFYSDYIRWINNVLIGEYKYFTRLDSHNFNKLCLLYKEVYSKTGVYLKESPNMNDSLYNELMEHLVDPTEYILRGNTRKRS